MDLLLLLLQVDVDSTEWELPLRGQGQRGPWLGAALGLCLAPFLHLTVRAGVGTQMPGRGQGGAKADMMPGAPSILS